MGGGTEVLTPRSRRPRGVVDPRRFGDAPLFRPPGWTWRRFGPIGWWVRNEWQQALLGPTGLRLEEWAAEQRVKTVKTGPHRVVYRVDLPEGAIYVKHFKVPGLREILRQWMRRGKGRNEAKRARKLAREGIPTITPIALGEERHRAFLFENFLISPEIGGARPLDEFVERILPGLSGEDAPRIRRALARELASLTAKLHDCGFLHQDFHPGNLLVKRDEGGQIRLTMIDLDALRRKKHLRLRTVRDNLALLNHYFWLRSNRGDRLRFLKHYLELRGLPVDAGFVASYGRSIEGATREWAERLWSRWGKRCRGTNKYFYVEKSDLAWGVAARSIDATTIRSLLADPDAPFAAAGTKLIKSSRTTTVAEATLVVDGVATPVIYKRFNKKKWLEPVLNCLRPTRAWRAWRAAGHLSARGVATPPNLVYIERALASRRWPLLRGMAHTSYVVVRKAEPSQTLGDFAREVLPAMEASARRRIERGLCVALARLVRTLHERSLSHRDLKAANILIVGEAGAANFTLELIDLVGVELRHPLPARKVVQNLARLYLSLAETPGRNRSDYLRFLKSYLPWASTRRAEWKRLWREVGRAAGVKQRQNERRGRPLS